MKVIKIDDKEILTHPSSSYAHSEILVVVANEDEVRIGNHVLTHDEVTCLVFRLTRWLEKGSMMTEQEKKESKDG